MLVNAGLEERKTYETDAKTVQLVKNHTNGDSGVQGMSINQQQIALVRFGRPLGQRSVPELRFETLIPFDFQVVRATCARLARHGQVGPECGAQIMFSVRNQHQT